MSDLLSTPIEYLKGVGPKRGSVLRSELSIFTFGDLLYYFPFRYIDRSEFQLISQIPNYEGAVQLKGQITSVREIGTGRGKRLEATFRDDSGIMNLVWFKGIKWIQPKLQPGTQLIVWGKAKLYGTTQTISHPELEFILPDKPLEQGLQPVYHSSEKLQNAGFNTRGIERIVKELLPAVKNQVTEDLPQWFMGELALMNKENLVINIHYPPNLNAAKKAQFRLKFQELF